MTLSGFVVLTSLTQRVAWHREDWRGRDAAAAGLIHHRQRQRIGTLTVGDCILRGSLQYKNGTRD